MSSKSKLKIVSLKTYENMLQKETDPAKKAQLRMLIDEMGEVYPDSSEIPDDPKTLFITPDQWKSTKLKRQIVMGYVGPSFTGKTFDVLSTSHLTPKYIKNDFKKIPKPTLTRFLDFISTYIPFTPLWVIGTEESTLECLRSYDNEGYFEHANINYTEILTKGSGMTLIDQIQTYKKFLIILYALSSQTRGTLVLDSATGILDAQHEIVRRVIGKIPKLKKEQGILPRHWFWRNVESQGVMFYGRIVKMNFLFTVKNIIQHKEDGEDIDKIKWHEETHKHLSSIIIRNERIGNKTDFRSVIEKCRPTVRLTNKAFKNMTMPLFMWNLFLAREEILKERGLI